MKSLMFFDVETPNRRNDRICALEHVYVKFDCW
ncbi:hypothetical protein HNQ47_001338 [Catenisphaera adipataccumulans]|uniref:Uncharacterized protein n=1 Tax=Catenisphaera adipataccumulans TaxID=700500 RepID=A0A7W8CZQ4_9FIRM|nr:hypothetical protein [Catenisphaera adipataccumulans]